MTRVIIDGEVVVMPHFSGIGHYTLELLRAIDRQIDNNDSFSFSILINRKNIDKVRSFGLRNIQIVKTPFSLRISNGLKRRGIQPPLDMFFGRGIYIFPNYSSWPLLLSKAVTFVYDISYEKYPELAEPRNQVFLLQQVEQSAIRSNMVVTISESSKNDISTLYHLDKNHIKVLYPAVDTNIYRRRSNAEVQIIKNKYGVKGEYILFVGNIEPRKNISNLLLAYEKLPQNLQKKNSLLIIGAKGWQDGEIFNTINRLKKKGASVQFPNKYVSDKDLPAFYSGAKLFVYPSIYEGFGIPPIEAMACGAPVITANNSSLPEAVGNAALMVDALSVDSISAAMSRLIDDSGLREKLVQRGYEQVNKFSWDDSAYNFLQELKNIR